MSQQNQRISNQRRSLRDASFQSIMLGAGETYIGAFAIFLQASVLQLGVLATLPTFLGAVSQSVSVWLTDKLKKRRLIAVIGASANSFMFCLIAIVPLLQIADSTKLLVLGILVSLYFISSGIVSPAWNSLIGDLVEVSERATFFAKRNRTAGMAMFVSTICAGWLLDITTKWHYSSLGFASIFFVAAIARLFSARELWRHDDPPYNMSQEDKFSFWRFLVRAPWSNFAKFVFFFASINLGQALSAPYFSLYMLRDLHFSYLEFTIVIAVAVIAQFVWLKNWGQISHAFGNKRILTVCGYGVAINPILWLFYDKIWYLILVQIFSGIVWSGFNLAVQNFLFDAVSPQKRARCAAYQGIVNGFFVLVGSIIGAMLVPYLAVITVAVDGGLGHSSNLLYLFLISGVLRLISSLFLLPLFKEVREVAPSSYPELIFRISHIRPISGAVFSVIPLGRRLSKKEISSIEREK